MIKIEIKDFSYNTGAVSQKAFLEHIKIYEESVHKYNLTEKELIEYRGIKDDIILSNEFKALKLQEASCLNSIMLHELFFQTMTKQETSPGEKTVELMTKNFGSFSKWTSDFLLSAKASKGWCVLAFDQRSKIYRNIILDENDKGVILMAYPLIVLDCAEHAYFMDYGHSKDKYIKRFIKSINWNIVEKQARRV